LPRRFRGASVDARLRRLGREEIGRPLTTGSLSEQRCICALVEANCGAAQIAVSGWRLGSWGVMLRVGLIVPAGFSAMSCATLAAFDTANFTAGEQFYDISVLSEHGGPVPNSFGTATETEPLDIKPFDTLLVAACPVPTPATPKLLAFLRQAVTDVRRVGSICSGTFALAEAGILDGRRATTHWVWAQELERRFPKVRVEIDRIFIADGPVWTSAGMTAGIDMALGLVERDLGRDAARATAKMMVVHHRRAGGQSQHSAMLELDAKSDRVQDALAFARNNLRQPSDSGAARGGGAAQPSAIYPGVSHRNRSVACPRRRESSS